MNISAYRAGLSWLIALFLDDGLPSIGRPICPAQRRVVVDFFTFGLSHLDYLTGFQAGDQLDLCGYSCQPNPSVQIWVNAASARISTDELAVSFYFAVNTGAVGWIIGEVLGLEITRMPCCCRQQHKIRGDIDT